MLTNDILYIFLSLSLSLPFSCVCDVRAPIVRQLRLEYVDHLMTHFPGDWGKDPATSNPAARQEEWLVGTPPYRPTDLFFLIFTDLPVATDRPFQPILPSYRPILPVGSQNLLQIYQPR